MARRRPYAGGVAGRVLRPLRQADHDLPTPRRPRVRAEPDAREHSHSTGPARPAAPDHRRARRGHAQRHDVCPAQEPETNWPRSCSRASCPSASPQAPSCGSCRPSAAPQARALALSPNEPATEVQAAASAPPSGNEQRVCCSSRSPRGLGHGSADRSNSVAAAADPETGRGSRRGPRRPCRQRRRLPAPPRRAVPANPYSCNPPFTIDRVTEKKHFKAECL